MLNNQTLITIINDCAVGSTHLQRIGLVGSYVRGDYTGQSDIDLVFDNRLESLDDNSLQVALKIKSILYDQFRKETDFIVYGNMLSYAEKGKNPHKQRGYKKMREDLVWIWESGTVKGGS